MELPSDPPWPWLTPNKLETPTAREILLFSPRQAESCSSHASYYGRGSHSVRKEAFTAAIYCACVDFVRARIHPSSLAAQPPPCTRPPNACCMRTRTAQSFFVARKRQICCSLVTHHGLGSRSMPREEASSMEGYHNASAASNASTLRWPASTLPTVATSGTKFSKCINTLVACIYFQVQTAATSSAKFSERIHVRHVRHATATSTYVVLPAEATSTRLPPAPGQELRRHV